MEILDNQFTQEPDENGLHVTRDMRANWFITSKWAMFFAIVGFIITGISLLTIGAVIPMMSTIMTMSGQFEAAQMLQGISTYIIIIGVAASLVMFLIHYFHLRFSIDIKRALQFKEQTAFESAWRNLRNHFRIMGIIVIAYIVLYIVGIIAFSSIVAAMRS
ncbi:MAG: hypothetical protein KDC70_14240 [Saprospiraceae bacterium]|nr:hypothetical protein [Saprospiraceae bacterium]